MVLLTMPKQTNGLASPPNHPKTSAKNFPPVKCA